jgi:hypothetical protein
VTLHFYFANSEELDIVLDNTMNVESFLLDSIFLVGNAVFDPDKQLISKEDSMVLGINDDQLSFGFFVFLNPALNEFRLKNRLM